MYDQHEMSYSLGLTSGFGGLSASDLTVSLTFLGNNFFIASSVVNSSARFLRLGMGSPSGNGDET